MAEAEEKNVVIKLDNVVKYYGDNQVVKNLNLDIYQGEFLTLLGPSGCGKTTTLRMIAGFEEVSQGKILLEGEDVADKPPYVRNVNTVFQSYALFPHMNLFDNIAFGLVESQVKEKQFPFPFKGKQAEVKPRNKKQEIHDKVMAALEMVQLSGFEKRMPSQISGGQKQRVAIARALVNSPKVLLLDEPLGALDLKLRKQMQVELKHLQQKLGITFIYVTHDQEEALTMSDRIAIMNGGVMEQIGTAREIYERPRTKFVADFIGESNLLEAYVTSIQEDGLMELTMEAGKVTIKSQGFQMEEMVYLSVRPEHIKCSKHPVEGFHMIGMVKESIYVGVTIKTTVELSNSQLIKITNFPEDEILSVGEMVYLFWKEGKAVVLHTKEDMLYDLIDEAEKVL